MCDLFRNSNFKLSVAQPMQYDEELQFNESNVTLYLAELAEQISNFITYLAQKEKNPANKDFDKGPLNIDNMPHSQQFNNNFEDEQTTEDDIITTKKDLYRKFAEFASKGYIDNLASTAKGK